MASVTPDEPEADTCGAAFNNAWDCYCEWVHAPLSLPPPPFPPLTKRERLLF